MVTSLGDGNRGSEFFHLHMMSKKVSEPVARTYTSTTAVGSNLGGMTTNACLKDVGHRKVQPKDRRPVSYDDESSQ